MKKAPLLLLTSAFALASCGNPSSNDVVREDDLRVVTEQEKTVSSITVTDIYGRKTPVTDLRKTDKKVGIFYHVWHGFHTNGIYNISDLLENDPDSLWDIAGNSSSPSNVFHYWGEPLYGFYNSSDPWVITRHIELFTMAGVDYLVYDLTNTVIYVDAINAIFKELDKYQKQGWNVPKVAFYTNTKSAYTMKRCYDMFYKDGQYSNLWFSLDGVHPLIIGQSDDLLREYPDEYEEISNFFQIKESQWPDATKFNKKDGFPWMDWDYPQLNYNGTMSVSISQHPGMRMSEEGRTNHGRGFDYSTFQNDEETAEEGSNVEGQWKTVFDNYDKVDNAFITGWNEWIAVKKNDGRDVFFVDTFNEHYSRDMEMMRGGYGDNFYLQLTRNIRKFAFTEAKHYKYEEKTIINSDLSEDQWLNASTYLDFEGDALERDFISADKINRLYDDSNRNDIVKTQVTHDKENLYIRVETKQDISSPSSVDKGWMNILINTGESEKSFSGYNYVINRSVANGKTSIEKVDSDFYASKVGEGEITYSNNVMQVSIPLKLINKSNKDYSIAFKVCDNVQEASDMQDYYVSGDVAPIGRLGYSYGY